MALDPKTPLTVHMLLLDESKTRMFVRAYLGPRLLEAWLQKPEGNKLLTAEGRGWLKLTLMASLFFLPNGGSRSGTPQTLLVGDIPAEGLAILQKEFNL